MFMIRLWSGIYHSGVQVHGVEYGFGAHDHPTTGIFEVEPKQCPGFMFRKSILIGRTDLDPKEVRVFMEKLAQEFPGILTILSLRTAITSVMMCANSTMVNRLARIDCLVPTKTGKQRRFGREFHHLFSGFCIAIHLVLQPGFLCNCVLPAELNETKIRQVRSEDSVQEKKKLRSRSTRFMSSSNPVTSPSVTPCPSSSGSRSGRQRCFIPLTSRSFVHDDSASWSLKA
uniref:PPPDE domain-containing protein n=1 Tax=Salix viminalis TaxID=40686 RepID=A0A6N2KS85_SALVM